jgi:hypothetical protein
MKRPLFFGLIKVIHESLRTGTDNLDKSILNKWSMILCSHISCGPKVIVEYKFDYHEVMSTVAHIFGSFIILICISYLCTQPLVIKFTSCLAMVGGSLRVLQLLPPLKLVAMI